jgi:hypothetical protein
MTNELHRLVYYSRNCIVATPAQTVEEINHILATARINNSEAGITGALFFNSELFAQALEGPLPEVERIFEKIQRDPRHSDVVVIQSGKADSRNFPQWSMAFAGNSAESSFSGAANFNPDFSNSSALGEQILSMLRELVTQEDSWL